MFDRTFGFVEGTFGTASGADATGTTSDDSDGDAIYSNLVAVSPGLPVGDIFTTLTISFNGLTGGASATFVADTDTIGVYGIPEPGTVTLMLLGLAGFAIGRRRI